MKRREVPGIKPYESPAGGWGALRATAKAVRDQMGVGQAPLLLLRTNKPDGFDCPGCAWPDKDHTSTFQFCENGAKAVTWEATKRRVPPEFFAAHTVTELLQWPDHELEGEGRVTHPMAYDGVTDRYLPISWDAAFARIGEVLRTLPDPNRAEFYTSGRASNEAAFLYQLFAREYGTNNFPDCSNMCHEATSVGLPLSIGIGKGTVSLDDFDACDLIIAMGHNPGTNHPRMMGTLHEVSRRGATIVVFNPLRERALERFADPQDAMEMATMGSTNIASSYYQVKVGGDGAALTGIMKALVAMDRVGGGAADVLDHEFIAAHTNGFAALLDDLQKQSWAAIEESSGLTRGALESVATAYARAKATIVTYGMGIVQHMCGTNNVQQIANLLLLRGNFGKPGAGICPLRGHSNVQGDRSVGISERPGPALLEGIERAFGFKPPRMHGHDAVAAMQAIAAGESKVLVCLGGNLAIALPDPVGCRAAMRRLDLAVHVTTKLNRSHLWVGRESMILPCLGRTEIDLQSSGAQSVTVEDSMSMVHASRGRLQPASDQLRSEPAIIAGIARATLTDTRIDWEGMIADYDRIRDGIQAVFPEFENFNARIRHPGGFRLPLPPTERIWRTASGKAEFIVSVGNPDPSDTHSGAPADPAAGGAAAPAANAAAAGTFMLTSLRSHDQYNTTIYSLGDRYRGVFGRRDVLFMNEDDMRDCQIQHGDRVDIISLLPANPGAAAEAATSLRLCGITAIIYDIARGSVGAYYPEVNCLLPLGYGDRQSGTPSYKSIPVRIVASG